MAFGNGKKLSSAFSVAESVHSRSENAQKPWSFRPVSFTPVHARSKVLWTYVQAPLRRTSRHLLNVRPDNSMSYDQKIPVKAAKIRPEKGTFMTIVTKNRGYTYLQCACTQLSEFKEVKANSL